MATFQIYQDAEKENPQNVMGNVVGAPSGILKERKTIGLGLSGKNVQNQTRSNFSVINPNVNTNHGNGARNVREGGSKLALRPSAKSNDGSIEFETNKTGNKEATRAQALTKSKLVTKITTNVAATTTSALATNTDQENVNILNELEFERHHHQHITLESKDYGGGILEGKNDFSATPMSVSDVLSPMSVDRSNLSILDSVDKENQPELLQQLQQLQQQQQKLINEDDDEERLKNASDENGTSLAVAAKNQTQSQGGACSSSSAACTTIRNDRQRFFEVVEYQDAILEYFREGEKKHRPKPNYMRRQPDINYSMRTILVDWLVEVSEEYNLDTETLYLAISYIDRFLSHMSVIRSKLQLVGTAAMYIAAKYEEIYPPDVGEFVFITDDTYTKAQVLRMEQLILKILAFDLCTPTPYVFVNTYAVLTDMTNDLKFLTMYICELSLLEADPYLRFVPSIVSAAAHALARYIYDYEIWSTQLEEVTTYSLESLKEVFLYLCKTHKAATKLPQQAIQEKYKAKKYNEVSTLNPVELTSEQYDEITRNYNEKTAAEKARLEREKADATTNTDNVRRMISLMFN